MANKFDMHERALLKLLFQGQESELTSYEVPVSPECDYRFDGVIRLRKPVNGVKWLVGSSCRADDLERVVMRQMVARDIVMREEGKEPLCSTMFCIVVTDWTGSRKAVADRKLLDFAYRTSCISSFAYEGEDKLKPII